MSGCDPSKKGPESRLLLQGEVVLRSLLSTNDKTWRNAGGNGTNGSISSQTGNGEPNRTHQFIGIQGNAWAGILVAILGAAAVVMTTILLLACIRHASFRRRRRRQQDLDSIVSNARPYFDGMASMREMEMGRRLPGSETSYIGSGDVFENRKAPVICIQPDGMTIEIAVEEKISTQSDSSSDGADGLRDNCQCSTPEVLSSEEVDQTILPSGISQNIREQAVGNGVVTEEVNRPVHFRSRSVDSSVGFSADDAYHNDRWRENSFTRPWWMEYS